MNISLTLFFQVQIYEGHNFIQIRKVFLLIARDMSDATTPVVASFLFDETYQPYADDERVYIGLAVRVFWVSCRSSKQRKLLLPQIVICTLCAPDISWRVYRMSLKRLSKQKTRICYAGFHNIGGGQLFGIQRGVFKRQEMRSNLGLHLAQFTGESFKLIQHPG